MMMSFSLISGLLFVPANLVLAQGAGDVVSTAQTDESAYESKLQPCFGLDAGGLNIGGCMSRFTYFLAYLSAQLVRLTGEVFDYFLAYSIDSGSYQGTNNQFVERGWSVIRDIANVGFIFTLLYIAIRHILQAGGADTKKLIKSLIIAALLINFSLFFTKIMIDAGNILARAFYNNIEVLNEENPDHKSISAGIADKLEPQKLVSSNLFKPVDAVGREPQYLSNGWATLILGLATFVNVTLALTFLSVFLLFAARVIGLWFMMIFSPLAFLSIAMPSVGKYFGQFGWSEWLGQTMKLSLMAPIFMFFLFLLVMFLEMIYTSQIPSPDQTSVQQIMAVVVPFIAVITIIRMAKDQAKDMAGKAGEALIGAVGKIAGFGAGMVLGGAGIAGRAVLGAGAAKLADKNWFKNAASNNMFARQLYKFTDKTSKASFDARNTAVGRATAEYMVKELGGLGSAMEKRLTTGTKKGGYAQRLEEYQKEKEKFKEQLRTDDQKTMNVTYHTIRRDAAGNPVIDPATGQPEMIEHVVKKSVIEAETDFLKKQNEAKKDDSNRDILDSAGNVIDTKKLDYDGWVKEREKTEKNRKQKESDYAEAQRAYAANATAANLVAMNNALADKTLAKEKHEGVSRVIKGIESNWEREEKDFKEVKKARDLQDVNRFRLYAQSVKSNPLSWIYDVAQGKNPSARGGASANIGLAAEKDEKKAQAEAKKDDKKT